MTHTLLIILVGLLTAIGGPTDMQGTLRNYQCGRCGTLIRADHTPTVEGCRSGSTHRWQDLGELGHEYYCCQRCATVVEARQTPSTLNCPITGKHHWNHLGQIGPVNYRCDRCSISLDCKRTPSKAGCPRGGVHQWQRTDN